MMFMVTCIVKRGSNERLDEFLPINIMLIDLLHKSHNAPVPHPTVYHFVTEMRLSVHIYVTKRCIVGYLCAAMWDLWDGRYEDMYNLKLPKRRPQISIFQARSLEFLSGEEMDTPTKRLYYYSDILGAIRHTEKRQRWPVNSPTKGQWCGKRLHVKTSSWFRIMSLVFHWSYYIC